MKKVLFPILAVILALGLALPMAAVVGAAVDPVILYGTRLGAYGGDIYEIDVANGGATLLKDLNVNPAQGSWPNGNAFDGINNRLYYSTYENGGTGSDLYFYDFDTDTTTFSGSLYGVSAGAEFYQGKYYYVVNWTANLRAVSFNANGTIDSDDSIIADFTPDSTTYGFGDLVITPDGMLYASTAEGFFSINLSTNVYTAYATADAYPLQLAIGSDGVIYGHSAGTGDFYEVDVSDGTKTTSGVKIDTLKFTDLASGPYPSIEVTKATTWTGFATIGDEIDYTYDVHNDGNVTLTGLGVTDSLGITVSPVESGGYNVGDTNTDGNLDPCETWQFTASYTVVEVDLENCKLHNIATAIAYYEAEPVTDTDELDIDLAKIIILCAGQHIPVGTVTVVNDGTELTVTYQTTGGWLMTELHLHVAENLEDIPQTQPNKKGKGGGNPIPGHFDENVEFDPPTDFWEKTYDLGDEGWEGCVTNLFIAAHAVVVFFDETCIDFEAYSEFDEVGTVSTPNGDVNFYMTDYTPLAALAVGEYAALAPSGYLPVVASPGTNDNPPSTYPNIVAFTTDGSPYTGADDIVLEDNGTGAGGNTLTDPQDTSQTELMWHAYSQFLGIVIDVTGLDWVEDLGLVTIDLDHGELWHFLYFDADGILIHKDTIAAGTGSYDGEAFPISWTDDEYSIAKVVVFGEMNTNVAGIVGYAIDNICITSVVQEETAWAGGECDTKENVKDFPGANWATYFTYHVMLCNGD